MEFSFDNFSSCLNQAFRLVDGDTEIELSLVRAERHSNDASVAGFEPYSLVFQSPPGPVLPQRLYRLKHAEHGDFDLFIVPIGQDDNGVRYEAIFS